MKLKIWVDGCCEKTVDTEKEWEIPSEEWNGYSEDEKYEIVQKWVDEHISYGFKEQP